MKIIAPSFLAADIWRTKEQVSAVEAAGCKYLHLDIMDGRFVPNISFGPGFVAQLHPHSKMVFDTHLMVEEPDYLFPAFVKAGSEFITIHAEACRHLDRSLHSIKELGCKAGVALNPATPLSMVEEVLDLCDLVLLMSVNPGFGGQHFILNTLQRLSRLARIRSDQGLDFLIEVDGGICPDTVREAADCGADILVAGSAVFGKEDPAAAYRELTALAND